MSDDLKEHAAELRRRAAQKDQTPGEQGSGSQNLDHMIDLRLNDRTPQPAQAQASTATPAPATVRGNTPSRSTTNKRTPKTSASKTSRPARVPQLAINIDADLHARSSTAAEQAKVSYAEYIRQVIEHYAHQIAPKKPAIRRNGSARSAIRITVRITQSHNDLIDKHTERTNRGKTSIVNMCVHTALADNFAPVIEHDDY